MLTDIDFLVAFDLISQGRLRLEETLVPADCPSMANSPYRPGYGWLFYYERRLARFLDKWLYAHRNQLIGENGIISEALSNAFSHGHKKDPGKPIKVKVFVGNKGLLLRISDQGRGYDVSHVLSLLKQRKNYYHTAGNGLQAMAASSEFAVFFDDGGRSFHLLYLSQQNYNSLSNLTLIPSRRPLKRPLHRTQYRLPASAKAPAQNLDQWAKGAIRVGSDMKVVASYGLKGSLLADIVNVCFDVYATALGMCRQVGFGFPENIWINSDRATFVIRKYVPVEGQWLIVRLADKASPAQAALYLPQLYRALSRTPRPLD